MASQDVRIRNPGTRTGTRIARTIFDDDSGGRGNEAEESEEFHLVQNHFQFVFFVSKEYLSFFSLPRKVFVKMSE